MTLFDHRREQIQKQSAPLAARMRPDSIDDFVDQKHLVGKGAVIRTAIDEDRIPSMIFWGPPGSGKTTLARLIAHVTKARFEQLSAVTSGVRDLREIITSAADRIGQNDEKTILFVDEIHRFSKSQQDVLLPHVENGTVTLIGATTENPSFEVISPLLSRTLVCTLEKLSSNSIGALVDRALVDKTRGLGNDRAELAKEAKDLLVRLCDGDARMALNTLELAVKSTAADDSETKTIKVETVQEAVHYQVKYDRLGEAHYDTISAFIKSVRASDPNASLYYLARMIEAGEDPMFIARRLVILAAEDIGLANPQAIVLATSVQQAVRLVGMPEGRIPLSEATIYLAASPKSNTAYTAIDQALKDVRGGLGNEPIPMHLRNVPTDLMRQLGYGEGYKYAHDFPGNFVKQNNLPDALRKADFYRPSTNGLEKGISDRLNYWWGDEKYSRKKD